MSASFDTTVAGTPETRWIPALMHTAWWQPSPAPLVVVAPHPDDETLGAGGLIATWAEQGFEVSIVLVTDGEAAHTHHADLRSMRVAELRAALACLAPAGGKLHRLQFPDGQVAARESQLFEALSTLIPQGATLVAPYEADGHTDHDATGRVCLRLAREQNIALARYPVWAWHRLEPEAFVDTAMGRFRLSDRAQRRKARALRCYRSQTREGEAPAVLPSHMLKHFGRPYEVFLL